MGLDVHCIASHEKWLEETGEVELIGGWAEIPLAADFAAVVDTSNYQVFVTSYDAVPVFVANRGATGFEIHALPISGSPPVHDPVRVSRDRAKTCIPEWPTPILGYGSLRGTA